jgi:ribonuclease HII
MKSQAKALTAKDAHPPSLRDFDAGFGHPVCGIDEVGRGPLAGPVIAACAFIPSEKINHPVWLSVNDSKKLSAQKRGYLYEIIIGQCHYKTAMCSVEEIDTLNIHHATLLAMHRAYDALMVELPPKHIALIDGKFAPRLSTPRIETVIKGDGTSLSIAAASIIAKVTRDRLMATLHETYPVYGWADNVGYGTPVHMDAIARFGISPHHRRSFVPCRDVE